MEENRLKQRLVGATVLVALGVIFIPMLLSSDPDAGMSLFTSNIPPETVALDPDPIDLAGLPRAPEPMPPRALPLKVERPEPAAAPQPPPQPEAPDVPVATPAEEAAAAAGAAAAKSWVVQLASFSREANALALRDKLLARHHHAFVESVQANGATVYRVRVGPEVRRESAERLRERLLKETELEGLVMPHP